MPQHWDISHIWAGFCQNIGTLNRIRLWNWLCYSKNKISNYLFNWNLQNFRNSTWISHIYDLFNELNMLDNSEQGLEININQTSERF